MSTPDPPVGVARDTSPRASVLRRVLDVLFIAAVVVGWGFLLDVWFLSIFGLWPKP